jgi:hypothetical protein
MAARRPVHWIAEQFQRLSALMMKYHTKIPELSVCLLFECHDCLRDGRDRNMEGSRISKQRATDEAASLPEDGHEFRLASAQRCSPRPGPP